MADSVTERCIVPLQAVLDLLGVRIEQKLMPVESQSLGRIIRAMHPIAIAQPGTRFWQIAMPYLVRLFRQRHPMDFAPPGLVKQAEFELLRPFRGQSAVHSFSIPRS